MDIDKKSSAITTEKEAEFVTQKRNGTYWKMEQF